MTNWGVKVMIGHIESTYMVEALGSEEAIRLLIEYFESQEFRNYTITGVSRLYLINKEGK